MLWPSHVKYILKWSPAHNNGSLLRTTLSLALRRTNAFAVLLDCNIPTLMAIKMLVVDSCWEMRVGCLEVYTTVCMFLPLAMSTGLWPRRQRHGVRGPPSIVALHVRKSRVRSALPFCHLQGERSPGCSDRSAGTCDDLSGWASARARSSHTHISRDGLNAALSTATCHLTFIPRPMRYFTSSVIFPTISGKCLRFHQILLKCRGIAMNHCYVLVHFLLNLYSRDIDVMPLTIVY